MPSGKTVDKLISGAQTSDYVYRLIHSFRLWTLFKILKWKNSSYRKQNLHVTTPVSMHALYHSESSDWNH